MSSVRVRCTQRLRQQRWATMRDRVNSLKLAEEAEANRNRSTNGLPEQVDPASMTGEELQRRLESLQREMKLDRQHNTGYADVDDSANRVEEIVQAMTEEEIRENQEIIKRMLVRGLRAFAIIGFGMSVVIYVYRRKRAEVAERKRLSSRDEDASVTLKEFQEAFESAISEDDESEVEAATPAQATAA
ncbi:hypothetical protein DIPPA_14862 [Diplonema papillatum]|nr:hypothetical protein DIPPA_14862 [Diplonema papillatum]